MYFKDGGLMLKQENHIVLDSPCQLTAAQLLARMIQYAGVSGSLVLPSGVDMDAGVALGSNMAFDFYIINTGPDITLVTNANLLLVGNMVVRGESTGCFRIRKTNKSAYTIYRLS